MNSKKKKGIKNFPNEQIARKINALVYVCVSKKVSHVFGTPPG